MGVFGAICSFVSSACSAVAGAIGGAIGSFVSSVSNALSTIGSSGLISGLVDAISNIVSFIGSLFGVNEEGEEMDELGAKACQEGVKKSEEFESTEDYIKYLREDIALDREAFDKKSPEEKIAYKLVGTSIVTKGIEEKTGMELSPEFLVAAAKCDMKKEEVQSYMETFKENGINDMTVMSDYLNGKCNDKDVEKTGDAISLAISKANPEMSAKEVDDKLGKMIDDLS